LISALIATFHGSFHKFFWVFIFRESVAQKIADLRTVNSLMASRAPAGSATQERGVIHIADINCTGGGLLLEMAPQTECRIARNEQSGVHTPVWIVAGHAPFVHRFMLEYKRTGLRRVAFGADLIERREFRATAWNYRTFVRVVAVSATHVAFDNGMVRRQIELSLLVHMALETNLR
jgi:hypothetical protein